MFYNSYLCTFYKAMNSNTVIQEETYLAGSQIVFS